ncbi:RmlC-like cupin domain-containing protein [Schizophyllum commune]
MLRTLIRSLSPHLSPHKQTPLLSNESFFSTSSLRNMAAAQKSRSVVKKVYAVETPEGEGALVRRSIGSMSLRNLSPFLMLDHFHISKGGFPDHPHRGQATVTYMLQGTSNHEDSAGHAGTLRQGGVQWMTAGRGIMHAEMPVLKKGEPEPDGLQLWIDLPKQYKMMEPNYQELDPESIPTAYPEGKDGPTQIKVISGKSYGVESPVKPYGGCWYFHVIMSKKGSSIFQDCGWTAFIYLFKGAVTVGDETTPNEKYHTLVLDSGKDGETGVSITSAEDGTEFVIVAGEPLDQPVVQYGPFVMTSREEIQKTFLDYQMGINGFEGAREWKSKIGGR